MFGQRMVFVHSHKREEGIVGFPKYFGVERKSGSCIAQASGWYYLETQLAWTLMAVNGLL